MLVSLALVAVTGEPIIDSIVSMGIAAYMLYSSVHIVRAGLHIVMDRSLEKDVVERIQTLLGGVPAIESFHDLKTGPTTKVLMHADPLGG